MFVFFFSLLIGLAYSIQEDEKSARGNYNKNLVTYPTDTTELSEDMLKTGSKITEVRRLVVETPIKIIFHTIKCVM